MGIPTTDRDHEEEGSQCLTLHSDLRSERRAAAGWGSNQSRNENVSNPIYKKKEGENTCCLLFFT